MRADLDAEAFAAGAKVREPHIRRLEALGVSLSALAALGRHQPAFGIERIREESGGLWVPDPDGYLAAIVPVVEHWLVDCSGVLLDTVEIVDLVAFRTASPMRWRWRTGDGWALGAGHLIGDAPIDLVASPLAWLASAGRAMCLLDWELRPQRWRQLRDGPPIVTADEMLRRRLNDKFSASIPPIVLAPVNVEPTSRSRRYA